jgi:hypothetical protein
MKNRNINTYGLECLKELLGDSLIVKNKIKYFVYDGAEYQLKVSVTDLYSDTNQFNQMETINMAIHILGMGTLDSEIDWMLLSPIDVARLSMGKKSQHGGLVAEDFIATLDEIDSSYYVKSERLKESIEKLIESQKSDYNYKLLESRMMIEKILKDKSKKNYESFLSDFVANLP